MKSTRHAVDTTKQTVSAKERFAMKMKWAEFVFYKRMTNWLAALLSVCAVVGVLGGVLKGGGISVATVVIVVCIARLLNTLFKR